jgi:phosphate transport system protein
MATHRHVDQELDDLKQALMTMGSLVEQAVGHAARSILSPSVGSREAARDGERRLDDLETSIEDRCQTIIALQAPMAGDLRLVVAAMRIAADLEQAGDHAESIAKRATWIAKHHLITIPAPLPALCDLVRTMMAQAVGSFLQDAARSAPILIREEERSDDLTKESYEAIQAVMVADTAHVAEYTHLLRAVTHLENIADLAVAIAEEGVYIASGRSIRHDHPRT